MLLPITAVIAGLIVLVWSADRFVDGSASFAKSIGMPSLLIGMVIVGFGTSAPEMIVSALSAWEGSPGIALGNAYGSNMFNIGFILGLTAILLPVTVTSRVLQKELPLLCAISILAAFQFMDLEITREDSFFLFVVFLFLVAWSIREGLSNKTDALAEETEKELSEKRLGRRESLIYIASGLFFLILSSRALVWGGVEIARSLGVSDLIIGLTIVAAGTSLPELASSIVAARKNESDIVVGNIIGSNFFNTLAVVGLASVISPIKVDESLLTRDIPVMLLFTVSMLLLGYSRKGKARVIGRFEGILLVAGYIAYTIYLISTARPAGA